MNNCNNGFINDYSFPSSKICKCSYNTKCNICTLVSIRYNKCISCNTEEGYYPIINNSSNFSLFIDCYNNTTIKEGYFFNIQTNYYEKCYSTCKKCNSLGNKNNLKCIECISGYELKNDFENDIIIILILQIIIIV